MRSLIGTDESKFTVAICLAIGAPIQRTRELTLVTVGGKEWLTIISRTAFFYLL